MATSERFGIAAGDEHRSSQLAIAIVRILADRHPNMRVPEDNFFKRSDSRSKLTSGEPYDNVSRPTTTSQQVQEDTKVFVSMKLLVLTTQAQGDDCSL